MKQIINVLFKILHIHRWEYYQRSYKIDIGGIKEISLLHRKCKITGLRQREILPRLSGIKSFKEYKSTDISDIREDKINQILK